MAAQVHIDENRPSSTREKVSQGMSAAGIEQKGQNQPKYWQIGLGRSWGQFGRCPAMSMAPSPKVEHRNSHFSCSIFQTLY
jgi:hypothetical protein